MDLLAWTLPLWRTRRMAWRVSWLLGLWMVIEAVRGFHLMGLPGIVVGAVTPALVMLVHALGHLLAERAVGGTRAVMVLGLMVEQGEALIPLRPVAHTVAALGGPLANGLLWLACTQARTVVDGVSGAALAFIAGTSAVVAVLNLLACAPLDGQRLWRGLLWLFLPMAQAVRGAVALGFLSAAGLLIWGVSGGDFMLAVIGVMSLMTMVQERQMIADGHDPVFGVDPRFGGRGERGGLLRWWSRRLAEREARELEREQETLDRLLAKVGEHGLPSLSAAERKELQRISARQRERDQR